MIYPPLVSVIMPSYNCGNYICEAIDSVLGQSLSNFELIIVDDCSNDKTAEILTSYEDPRIVRIVNKSNLGPSMSRNIALNYAQGNYVAIMDADDVSLPQRLQKQVRYLEQHSDVGIIGSWTRTIDRAGREVETLRRSNCDALLKWETLFSPQFTHSSVMCRSQLLQMSGGYPSFNLAEDYDLWSRLFFLTKFSNFQDVLVLYRSHNESISEINSQNLDRYTRKVSMELISRFTQQDVEEDIFSVLIGNGEAKSTAMLVKTIFLLLKLMLMFIKRSSCTLQELILILTSVMRRIYSIARNNDGFLAGKFLISISTSYFRVIRRWQNKLNAWEYKTDLPVE